MSGLIRDFNCYITANKVNDIIPEEIDCLLILESPHKNELEKNLPLVGRTGELVSDFFKVTDMSFGEFVSKHNEHKIGIMNVCQAPLQKTDSVKHKHYYDYNTLSRVRKNHKAIKNHRCNKKEIEACEDIILSDFLKRLKNALLKNSELRILVCGKFAKSYVNYVKKDIEEMQKLNNQILFAAHPSRNSWRRLNKEESKELKNYVRFI